MAVDPTGQTTMNSRFKSNDFFALLIAIILILIGFTLGFIHKQTTNKETRVPDKTQKTVATEILPVSADALGKVARIHERHGIPRVQTPDKTELQLIRDSIDWSDAPSPKPELVKTDDYDVYINVTVDYLTYVFDKLGYTGEKIDTGETGAVPPLIVVSIKKGWSNDQTVQFRKSIFYRVMLSLVLYENDAVLRERETLLEILDNPANNGDFSAEQMQHLVALAFSYRVIAKEALDSLDSEQIQELLTRVDMVSPSLALAQAAHESGYATSRFAYPANALFGQWDWSADAVKPQQQRQGMGNYGVESFNQPIDSVRSYVRNLNTHRAYAEFRKLRAAQRGNQRGRIVLDSLPLADTLISYSERGSEYTEELKNTISYNRLERGDNLRLMQGKPIYFN